MGSITINLKEKIDAKEKFYIYVWDKKDKKVDKNLKGEYGIIISLNPESLDITYNEELKHYEYKTRYFNFIREGHEITIENKIKQFKKDYNY